MGRQRFVLEAHRFAALRFFLRTVRCFLQKSGLPKEVIDFPQKVIDFPQEVIDFFGIRPIRTVVQFAVGFIRSTGNITCKPFI
ncbi:MAG: hypothetical protein K2N36_00380 [Ruminiclostridium sp.]|nr:hypothetical protein [Ruminiclostridium sp.]